MKHFIPNIDDANIRILQLEKERGLAASEFIANIDDANARIEELEGQSSRAGMPAGSPAQPATANLTGIRRAIAANGGGIVPPYRDGGESAKGAGLARAIAANQQLAARQQRTKS